MTSPFRALPHSASLPALALLAAGLLGALCGVAFQRQVGVGPALAWLGLSQMVPKQADQATEAQQLVYRHHWWVRQGILAAQSRQIGDGAVIILGDSIMESFYPQRLSVGGQHCAVVNGGFSGIGMNDLSGLTPSLFASVRPRFALLSVGINDALTGVDAERWSKDYSRLVDLMISLGVTPALFTLFPPEPGLQYSAARDLSAIAELNTSIRRLAAERGLPLIDLAAVLTGPDGMARPGTTVDGIHPTPATLRAFEELWFPLAVEQLQRLSGADCAPPDRKAPSN